MPDFRRALLDAGLSQRQYAALVGLLSKMKPPGPTTLSKRATRRAAAPAEAFALLAVIRRYPELLEELGR